MCCLQELLPAPADVVAEAVVPPSFLLFASCAEASRAACPGRTWAHSVAAAAAVGAAGLVEEEEEEEQDGDEVRLVGEVTA